MWRGIVVSIVCLGFSLAHADVYRCPDGKGGTIYRNLPCDGKELVFKTTPSPRLAPLPSPEEFATSMRALAPLHDQWNDTMTLVSNASRLTLLGPLSTLQALRRQAVALPVVACLEISKSYLVRGMDKHIEALRNVLRSSGRWADDTLVREGNLLFREYAGYVEGCRS